jgi:hypothetical protein
LVLERDRLLRAATEAEFFKQTDQIRRSMLAAVSHDLRSPLAAIKASVTDLMDPDVTRTDEQRAEVLQTIDAETDRLDTLVTTLLDMSRSRPARGRLDGAVDRRGGRDREADAIGARLPDVRVATVTTRVTPAAEASGVPRACFQPADNAQGSVEGGDTRRSGRVGRQRGGCGVRVSTMAKVWTSAAREQLYPFYRLRRDVEPGTRRVSRRRFVELMEASSGSTKRPRGDIRALAARSIQR